MKYRALLLPVFVIFLVGCKQHLLTDYRPLDKAGMWSGGLEQLKALNTSDSEVAQLVRVKQAQLSDDTCIALVAPAPAGKHIFTSGDSTAHISRAGYHKAPLFYLPHAPRPQTIPTAPLPRPSPP